MTTHDKFFSIGFFLIILISVYSARLLALAPALLLILIGLSAIYQKFISKQPIQRPAWQQSKAGLFSLLAILVLGSLSIVWSVFPDLSIDRVKKLLPLLVLGGGYFYVIKMVKGQLFNHLLFVGTVAACLIMQIDMYFDFGLYRLTRGISPDAYFMPSELNRAVCFLTLLTLLGTQMIKNKWCLSMVLLSYYLVFLYTESQTAQLGFLTGLLSFGLYKIFKQKVIYLYFIILLLVTLPLPWLIPYAYENRPDNPGVYLSYAANGYSRLEIWDGAARLIQEKPVIGYGIGTFREIELDMENIYHPDDKILHPHNISLQIWAEFGFVGILTFLLLNGWILKRIIALQAPSVQTLSLGIWSALMAMGLTGYGLWQGWWVGMIILIIGAINYYEQQIEVVKK